MASCRDFELDIVDYLDGVLTGPRLEALKAHLAECPDCARRAADMEQIMRATAELKKEPPAGLHEAIMARIDAAAAEKPGRLLRFPMRRIAGAAAAVIVLVCAAAVGSVLLRSGKAAPQRSMGDMLSAESRVYSAGAAAEEYESDEAVETDIAPSEAADTTAELPEAAAEEAVSEEEALEMGEEPEVPSAGPTGNAYSAADSENAGADDGLLKTLENRGARYCAVLIYETPILTEDPEGFPSGGEWIPCGEDGETAYCALVPVSELDGWTGSLSGIYTLRVRYDANAPGKAGTLMDPDAGEAALILRRSD